MRILPSTVLVVLATIIDWSDKQIHCFVLPSLPSAGKQNSRVYFSSSSSTVNSIQQDESPDGTPPQNQNQTPNRRDMEQQQPPPIRRQDRRQGGNVVPSVPDEVPTLSELLLLSSVPASTTIETSEEVASHETKVQLQTQTQKQTNCSSEINRSEKTSNAVSENSRLTAPSDPAIAARNALTTNKNNNNNIHKNHPTTAIRTKKRIREETIAEPWKAGYKSSIRTQSRIQGAANRGRTPLQRAVSVLKALIQYSQPERCNASNVICALTLSAKQLSIHSNSNNHNDNSNRFANMLKEQRSREEFESLLFETLHVLDEMVKQDQLTVRQLCNAAWAIAKHYTYNPTILPEIPMQAPLSSETIQGRAQIWKIKKEDDSSIANTTPQERLDQTLHEMAYRLTLKITNTTLTTTQPAKPGELCMASWAYATLRRRHRPPGWIMPPQLGRLPKDVMLPQTDRENEPSKKYVSHADTILNCKREEDDTDDDVVTFEERSDYSFSNDKSPTMRVNNKVTDSIPSQNDSQNPDMDPTNRLFQAMATVFCHPSFAHGLEEGTLLIQQCSWSELANVAWAYATRGGDCLDSRPCVEMMVLLSNETALRMSQSSSIVTTNRILSRDVAQIVWSMGVAQSDNYRISGALVKVVNAICHHWEVVEISDDVIFATRPFQKWSCRDLVQLAVALGHGRIGNNLPLLKTIYSEALFKMSHTNEMFQSWELTVLLWVQARLYLTTAPVFQDFAKAVPKELMNRIHASRQQPLSIESIGLGAQEQANLAWSLTVLEEYETDESVSILQHIFQAAAVASSSNKHVIDGNRIIQLEHAHQLWQAYFILKTDCPAAIENTPQWFCDFLQEKWSLEKSKRKTSSARHQSLSQTLNFMGVAHYNEHDEDIDVAIVLKEDSSWTHTANTTVDEQSNPLHKVAVEFDGPHHFTLEADLPTNTVSDSPVQPHSMSPKRKPRALGHTVLKYRLLKSQGWTVVRVPYYEYDKIPFWASMVSAS
eukprot:scaffold58325_cov56-Attheya_sp.AAC.3